MNAPDRPRLYLVDTSWDPDTGAGAGTLCPLLWQWSPLPPDTYALLADRNEIRGADPDPATLQDLIGRADLAVVDLTCDTPQLRRELAWVRDAAVPVLAVALEGVDLEPGLAEASAGPVHRYHDPGLGEPSVHWFVDAIPAALAR